MYINFFRFIENPFSIAPDPRYLYMSDMHQDGLAHLKYGLSPDGCIMLLTGEVGTGKTTLCRYFLEQLEPTANIALIINPGLNAFDLLVTVCDEFGIPVSNDLYTTKHYLDALNQFLLQAHADNNPALLIIDEAQNLDKDALEMVRLLTNLETNKQKLLKIFLLGQSELSSVLAGPDMTQVNQRITGRFHLQGLSAVDTAAYIIHRISVAGGEKKQIFNDKAVKRVHQITGGIPRLINSLCDRALLGAYAEDRYIVDETIVKKAAREIFGFDRAAKTIKIPVSSLITATIAVFLIILVWAGTTSDLFHLKLSTLLSQPAEENRQAIAAPQKQTEPVDPVPAETARLTGSEQLPPETADIDKTGTEQSDKQADESDGEEEPATDLQIASSIFIAPMEIASGPAADEEKEEENEEEPNTRIVIQHIEIAN